MVTKRKPRPKPKEFTQRKRNVKDRSGYIMRHVLYTTDQNEVLKLDRFYKRAGKNYRILKNGNGWDVFVEKDSR